MIEQCGDELIDAPWIQTAGQMRAGEGFIEPAHQLMEPLIYHLQCLAAVQ